MSYFDTVTSEKVSEWFQALGSKLTLANLEANPRELSESEAQDLGKQLTEEWQQKVIEASDGNLVSPDLAVAEAVVLEFGSDEDKAAFEAWKSASL